MKLTPNLTAAQVQQDWYVVDATDVPLGRLSTHIATYLRGKHKPTYTPFLDDGDHVVVINAEKVKLTGHKLHNHDFKYYTGYVGGLRTETAKETLEGKHPGRLIERAVQRMMPKESALARAMFKKLHVYAGSEHPHGAQNPKPITFAQ